MSKRSPQVLLAHWKRTASVKFDPPARVGFGAMVVEHILNNFYIDRGKIKRRKWPLLKELTWAEKINRKKSVC